MHLSVSQETFITVYDSDTERMVQKPIRDATGAQTVMGWWGGTYDIVVSAADKEEQYYMTTCSSGEAFVIGESHSVYSRDPRRAKWERVPAVGMEELRFVKLPQKKTTTHETLFPVYDADESGIHLVPPKASAMFDLMRHAAWSGIAVSRRKSELRIDLDRGRASCFASKLVNGAFDVNLEEALSSLVASTVIRPPWKFEEMYIDFVKTSGVIIEGGAYNNDVPFLPPRKLDRSGPVYHILLSDPDVPVELTWCHS